METLFTGNRGEDTVINSRSSCCFFFDGLIGKSAIISKYFEAMVALYHYKVWGFARAGGSEPFSHTKPTFDLLTTFGCPKSTHSSGKRV